MMMSRSFMSQNVAELDEMRRKKNHTTRLTSSSLQKFFFSVYLYLLSNEARIFDQFINGRIFKKKTETVWKLEKTDSNEFLKNTKEF